MDTRTEAATAFEAAVDAIPSCALTPAGLAEQRERHRRLSTATVAVTREEAVVIFAFDETLNRETLDEMVAVERECCPFFTFAFDEARRRLVVGVDSPEHLPALEAMAAALGAQA